MKQKFELFQHDKISALTVKDCIYEFCTPLFKIVNRSFEDGTVSVDLKVAKVIPAFKNEDR